MTDKSSFTDEEWKELTEAPLLVTLALFAAGEHGPISMVKEASASARHHRLHLPPAAPLTSSSSRSPRKLESAKAPQRAPASSRKTEQVAEASLADLGGAATALRKLRTKRLAGRGLVRRHRQGGRGGCEDDHPCGAGRRSTRSQVFEIPSS
jgi:hypothetical protein